jgi:hypothetical protein
MHDLEFIAWTEVTYLKDPLHRYLVVMNKLLGYHMGVMHMVYSSSL